MSRLDQQVDEVFPQLLAQLEHDLNELKAGDQLIGPDSMRMRLVRSGATWDVLDALVPAYDTRSWRVTYVPSTIENAYADVGFVWQIMSGNGYEKASMWPDVQNTVGRTRAWIFNAAASDVNLVVRARFSVKSPDTGTLTAVAL